MTKTPFLTLREIDKRFGDLHVLDRVSLEVGRGEVLALLGRSGSGKTTLLRLLAGFESPDHGEIRVQGEDVTSLPPARRRFGMVFQHYALFPHLTVGQNVAFGLESEGWDKADIAPRVARMLEQVDLDGFENRPVGEISGGQQQRVALARALAPEPRILLLDEPLSNLDPTLRERTRRELKATIDEVGITTVLVTHEQEEAFDLGDRVAVLHGGRLQQVGTPDALYETPKTPFVATFVGRATILPGVLESVGADGIGTVRLELPGHPAWKGIPAVPVGQGLEIGDRVRYIARPESLELPRPGTSKYGEAISGRVVDRRYAGVLTYVTVSPGSDDAADAPELEVLTSTDAARVGDRVSVAPRPGSLRPRIFPAEPGTDR